MIIHHTAYDKIDFSKYKRVFIFGCSFTNYFCWPTWANILSMEAKNAEYVYNLGETGGGNLFISSQVMAASLKYKFNTDDLILLMWSTHCREDRYKDTRWVCPGNIWTQNIISEDFVKEWACPKGYIVRDLALMALTKTFLSNSPADAVLLKSVDPGYDQKLFDGFGYEEVLELYKDTIEDYPKSLHSFSFVNDGHGGWINGHEYYWPGVGNSSDTKKFQDYHPNPSMYMDFLTQIGFKLSEDTMRNVTQINDEMRGVDNFKSLRGWRNAVIQRLVPGNIDSPHII